MSDKQLAKALQNKNEEAFEEIVLSYSKLLWAVAYSVLGKQADSATVEEIVSDVFLRLWQAPEKYDPDRGSLKNYLALMTKSMAINKSSYRKKDFQVEDFPLEELPDAAPEETEISSLFFQAVDSLQEPTREMCIQRFFYEWKPERISQYFQINKKEVNNRLYKGKIKIRKKMQELINQGGW